MRRFLKLSILAVISAFFVLAAIVVIWASNISIPDFQSFENRKVIQSTKIYDNTGEILLYDIHQNISRTVINFTDIPRQVKNATVAIEDSGFYQHHGISWQGIFRSFLADIVSGSLQQGGSTITQQLVKNTLLTSEKSFTRKIKEIILSLKIEKMFSKEDILGLYLNEIPYGGNNYGIESASLYFFGKNAKNLTLAEAAYLAALPQAPTYYSPYGNHRDELENRKNIVLKRMLELGFISEDEMKQSQKEKVNFISRSEQNIKAPHFVMFIKSYLEEKYGKDTVEEEGLKVITTLDWDLQQKAEKIIAQFAADNEKNFNAKNAGLIAIDPKTGKILTMVGSRDYFNTENEGNFNVTLAKRQPGSSFKPFVYATAFQKGYTPETILFDLQTEFNSSCNPDGTPKEGTKSEECYRPENYDGIYRGPISLRNALAQSINIPSVKVLYLAGINDSLKTAQNLGITTLTDPLKYGLTLVLGGGEVTLLEMTGAYSVFANDGIKNPVIGIQRIENSKGEVLEEFISQPKQVLDQNISRLITDVLSDNEARTPAFGSQSYLYFPDRDVAAKTGTTNDYHDAWVIGYTPNFALGVWYGNNDNSPMEKKVAGFIAAPSWNAFFQEALKKLPPEKFIKPNPILSEIKPVLKGEWKGGNTYLIDSISKKRATEFTPKDLIEEKTIIQIHSILYWVNKDNPLGPIPSNPGLDPQFLLWETPIRDWAVKQGIQDETMANIPQDFDNIHLPLYIPVIQVISPQTGVVYDSKNAVNIKITSQSHFPLKEINLFLGNTFLGSVKQYPFDFSFIPKNYLSESELQKNLRIVAYDEVRNSSEVNIFLYFK